MKGTLQLCEPYSTHVVIHHEPPFHHNLVQPLVHLQDYHVPANLLQLSDFHLSTFLVEVVACSVDAQG